jgi:hypothetical protein
VPKLIHCIECSAPVSDGAYECPKCRSHSFKGGQCSACGKTDKVSNLLVDDYDDSGRGPFAHPECYRKSTGVENLQCSVCGEALPFRMPGSDREEESSLSRTTPAGPSVTKGYGEAMRLDWFAPCSNCGQRLDEPPRCNACGLLVWDKPVDRNIRNTAVPSIPFRRSFHARCAPPEYQPVPSISNHAPIATGVSSNAKTGLGLKILAFLIFCILYAFLSYVWRIFVRLNK